MIRCNKHVWFGALTLVLWSGFVSAQSDNWQNRSHLKYLYSFSSYPDDSIYRDVFGAQVNDNAINFRHDFSFNNSKWLFEADYEAIAMHSSSNQLGNATPFVGEQYPNDRERLFHLTQTVSNSDSSVVLQRLDRLYLGYQTENNVLKIGRQALSWGNGMFFSPMDFFNPFDPTAVDKEYKPGDDMLYFQHLYQSGNDLQVVWLGRRNVEGERDSTVNSAAAKYHMLVGDTEIDIVVARHFDDRIYGVGAVRSIGGGVLRGDLVNTKASSGDYSSYVGSYSYSWIGFDKNMSGVLEYFHNGFGLNRDQYQLQQLQAHEDLLARVERGELFVVGRDYLALNLQVEMTPLWLANLNCFSNIVDGSGLLQLVSQHNLRENLQFYLSLAQPFGGRGSEYGGLESSVPNRYLRVGTTLSAQLAYYF